MIPLRVRRLRAQINRENRILSLVILTLCALVSACDSGSSVQIGAGFQPRMLPVEFSVNLTIAPNGTVSYGGTIGFVTYIGNFSVAAQFESNIQPANDETILVIRHRVNGNEVDDAYRLGTGEEVLVSVDGVTNIRVANRKVLIDALRANISKIEVRNAPPPSVVQAQPGVRTPGKIGLARSMQSSDVQIMRLAWSPDGKMIATGGFSGDSDSPTVSEIRNVEDGTILAIHRGQIHLVYAVAWSPDGRFVASSAQSDTDGGGYSVHIWDARTGVTRTRIEAWAPENLDWSPDSQYVLTSGWYEPEVWRSQDGQRQQHYGGSRGINGSSAHWSPKGNYVVDGNGLVWDAKSGSDVLQHVGEYRLSVWSPDGSRIASAGSFSVDIWDSSSGATIWTKDLSLYGHPLLAWSPDGRFIVATSELSGQLLDALTGDVIATFDEFPTNVGALAWSPDGRYIATASGGKVQIWHSSK